MSRWVGALVVLLATAYARADSLPGVLTRPEPKGSSSEPRILLEQRLFGMAHAIGLLARACTPDPETGPAAHLAYANWHEKQLPVIDRARQELARFYFKDHADTASWSELVTALGLRNELALKPGSRKYRDACATLPAALASYRNDLGSQFTLQQALTRVTVATLTSARAEACLAKLDGDAEKKLKHSLEDWQQRFREDIERSRRDLAAQWHAAGFDSSLDQLIADTRKQAASGSGDCSRWASWLASPAADPDAPFENR
jgi:hypothetical protein